METKDRKAAIKIDPYTSKMVVVLCMELRNKPSPAPYLEPEQAWANLTADGKYRCTVCESTTHTVASRKRN